MKKIFIFVFSTVAALYMISCSDVLDEDKYFKNRETLESVFADKTKTEQWLAQAYTYLGGENMDVTNKDNNLFNFSDDIYFGDRDSYKQFKTGTYNEDFRQSWNQCYQGIRQASIFIDNVDNSVEMTDGERKDAKAQARFLRAYYYWLLLRKYGPVPIIPGDGTVDYTQSYADIAIGRNTYDECADYIAKEMCLAAKDLPLKRGDNNIARPTRGAALAARAYVLLFAASPYNNPHAGDAETFKDLVNDKGESLMAQSYDESKWARAAAAALDVINLNRYSLYTVPVRKEASPGFPITVTPYKDGDFSEKDWPEGYRNIDPYESYRSLFNGTVALSVNPELIFTRGRNQGSDNLQNMVRHQLPSTFGGWNTEGITQKQCDAYYMADGSDTPGKDSEYNIVGRSDKRERDSTFVTKNDIGKPGYEHTAVGVSKQYVGREPRFYASVAFNGSVWPLLNNAILVNPQPTEVQVFYYRGDGNGYINTNFWLRTGIGFMKYVHPDDTAVGGNNDHICIKPEPAIRYADILLMYAEALNELDNKYDIASWDSTKTYSVSRDINELKRGIRPVRCRAGVPDFSAEVYADKDLFRTKLKREREIELVGEGKRYFDLRRWKDAPIEESLKVYGCNALMTSSQRELFHKPVVIMDLPATFSRKLYFWPISHSELKRNAKLTQNPGWTYND